MTFVRVVSKAAQIPNPQPMPPNPYDHLGYYNAGGLSATQSMTVGFCSLPVCHIKLGGVTDLADDAPEISRAPNATPVIGHALQALQACGEADAGDGRSHCRRNCRLTSDSPGSCIGEGGTCPSSGFLPVGCSCTCDGLESAYQDHCEAPSNGHGDKIQVAAHSWGTVKPAMCKLPIIYAGGLCPDGAASCLHAGSNFISGISRVDPVPRLLRACCATWG